MQQRRARRAFTAEHEAQVVDQCRRGGRSIPEVARDIDLSERVVRRWLEPAVIDAGRGLA